MRNSGITPDDESALRSMLVLHPPPVSNAPVCLTMLYSRNDSYPSLTGTSIRSVCSLLWQVSTSPLLSQGAALSALVRVQIGLITHFRSNLIRLSFLLITFLQRIHRHNLLIERWFQYAVVSYEYVVDTPTRFALWVEELVNECVEYLITVFPFIHTRHLIQHSLHTNNIYITVLCNHHLSISRIEVKLV